MTLHCPRCGNQSKHDQEPITDLSPGGPIVDLLCPCGVWWRIDFNFIALNDLEIDPEESR